MTDPTPPPSRFPEALKLRAEKLVETCAKARHDWVDGMMKKLMPEDIYAKAWSKKATERSKAAAYLKKHNYRFREFGDKTELVRGVELIGEFQVRITDDKVQFLARDFLTKPSKDITNSDSATEA